MDLKTIDQMIKNAELKRQINMVLMRNATKENSPDGFLYALARIKYYKIRERLKQARLNYV
jgi:hypothetical protein